MKIPARKFKSMEVDEFESERQQLEKAAFVAVEDVNRPSIQEEPAHAGGV